MFSTTFSAIFLFNGSDSKIVTLDPGAIKGNKQIQDKSMQVSSVVSVTGSYNLYRFKSVSAALHLSNFFI